MPLLLSTLITVTCSQVELFCISKLINCVLEADMEFIVMDFHFAVGKITSSLTNNHVLMATAAAELTRDVLQGIKG